MKTTLIIKNTHTKNSSQIRKTYQIDKAYKVQIITTKELEMGMLNCKFCHNAIPRKLFQTKMDFIRLLEDNSHLIVCLNKLSMKVEIYPIISVLNVKKKILSGYL